MINYEVNQMNTINSLFTLLFGLFILPGVIFARLTYHRNARGGAAITRQDLLFNISVSAVIYCGLAIVFYNVI